MGFRRLSIADSLAASSLADWTCCFSSSPLASAMSRLLFASSALAAIASKLCFRFVSTSLSARIFSSVARCSASIWARSDAASTRACSLASRTAASSRSRSARERSRAARVSFNAASSDSRAARCASETARNCAARLLANSHATTAPTTIPTINQTTVMDSIYAKSSPNPSCCFGSLGFAAIADSEAVSTGFMGQRLVSHKYELLFAGGRRQALEAKDARVGPDVGHWLVGVVGGRHPVGGLQAVLLHRGVASLHFC